MEALVTTQWLSARLGAPDLVVLDASWFLPTTQRDPRVEFSQQHIPGSCFFDIDAIADTSRGLPHMLPPAKDFAAAARGLGVARRSVVVAYDSVGVWSSPRAWWSFRAMGHDSTFVLDGGLPKWLREGRPTEAGWPMTSVGDFQASPATGLVADIDEVRAAIQAGTAQIVDARPRERFRAQAPEPRPGLRGGHMPGAHNVPWADLVISGGALASAPDLSARFREAGVDLSRPVIATCGSGVSAALVALALARVGRTDVAVYDGSWAEWGARHDTPVVAGP